jgi:excinuclease ABC subunit B
MKFQIASKYKPKAEQGPVADKLVAGLRRGEKFQTLLGVTGSGKTYLMAAIVEKMQRPTLIMAPNKTLAAQLVAELRDMLPRNVVEYFVSYYDYYQPEAYLPNSDTYIEKEATINDEIDRLRHAATQALLSRRDVVTVASVSAIYGLGSPSEYQATILEIAVGDSKKTRANVIRKLVEMQFSRTNGDLTRGSFRARGSILEVLTTGQTSLLYRLSFGEEGVGKIEIIDNVTRKNLGVERAVSIFPAKHYVAPPSVIDAATARIKKDMTARLKIFAKDRKFLEAERLERRVKYDLEMIREVGYCNGIENYSRYFDGRQTGEPPYTLLDYFPKDYLLFIDESHVGVPQIRGMYEGDRARKETLVNYGFRLPSAKDNRPLKFDEFEQKIGQVIFTSATPGDYEKKHSTQTVELLVRPTGLVDPEVVVRPSDGQIDDLITEINKSIAVGERALVTTLTKKMAEDLSEHLKTLGTKVRYIHSSVETLDRLRILRDLRRGVVDVIVGVNLLREGLDLPEVSLVVILDADKEGFLRSETSLVQTIGRAARNVNGRVILYADNVTGSMKRAISETTRRRQIQVAYNKKHDITPQTIKKNITSILGEVHREVALDRVEKVMRYNDLPALIKEKEAQMKEAATTLRFEEAAILRDEVCELKKLGRLKKQ